MDVILLIAVLGLVALIILKKLAANVNAQSEPFPIYHRGENLSVRFQLVKHSL